MSDEWRRIAQYRRPISRLQLFVSADAEIEIRSGRTVLHRLSIPANNSLGLDSNNLYPWLPQSFSVFLNSIDPQCQWRIQAQYIEETTRHSLDNLMLADSPRINMAIGYGLMGLGIPPFPFAVSGAVVAYEMRPTAYDAVRERLRQPLIEERSKEQLKEEKPCPGITRLQAFKRELDEEKPKQKEKHKFLSKLKRKRGENKR